MDSRSRILFDTNLYLRRRNDAIINSHRFDKNPWFLHEYAADGIVEIIETIKQDFDNCLELFSCKNQFREKLLGNGLLGAAAKIKNLHEFEPSEFFQNKINCISDIENLPLNNQKYDLIIANSGLNWVNDLPGFLARIKASLNPEGCFIASFIGNSSLKELRDAFLNCEIEEFGGANMRINPMVELEAAVRLLMRAGFKMPVSSYESPKVRYANMFALIRDLKNMGENAAFFDKSSKILNRRIIAKIADYYQEKYKEDDGRVIATFDIITICGWA